STWPQQETLSALCHGIPVIPVVLEEDKVLSLQTMKDKRPGLTLVTAALPQDLRDDLKVDAAATSRTTVCKLIRSVADIVGNRGAERQLPGMVSRIAAAIRNSML